MTCSNTLKSIEVSCEGSAGGIKRVLVAPKDKIVIPAVSTATETAGKLLASAFKATESSVKFEEYKFRPQTGSMTSTSTIDIAIGSSSVTTELALQFTRMETTKRVAIQAAINTGSVAIVQDYNGKYWFLGMDMPIYGTGATAVTGQSVTDLNGYTLTLQDISFELPFEVSASDSDIATLLTAVPVAE